MGAVKNDSSFFIGLTSRDLSRNPHNFIDMWLVGCGDLDAPLPRKRHEIFGKARFADRRGELRSPFKIHTNFRPRTS